MLAAATGKEMVFFYCEHMSAFHRSQSSIGVECINVRPCRLMPTPFSSTASATQHWHVHARGDVQVATRRTRTAGKVEIPNVDDHVSKLEHMGKETVKKLQDLKLAALQAGMDISVPDNRVTKGGLAPARHLEPRAPSHHSGLALCSLAWTMAA